MNTDEKKGYVHLFIGSLFMTLTYLIVGYTFTTYPDTQVFDAGFYGMFGAMAFLSPYFLVSKKRRKTLHTEWKRNKKTLLKVSIFSFIGYLLWVYAFKNGTPGLVGFMKRLDVIFGFFLGILLLKERFSFRELVFAGISILGFIWIWVSNLKGEITPLASIGLIVSAFLYAFQSYFVKKNVFEMCSKSFSFLRLVIMVILLAITGYITKSIHILPIEIILLFALSQISGSFIYRYFYFKAHEHLSISKIALFSILSPVLIFLSSVLLLKESVGIEKVLGFLTIILGMVFFLLEKFRLNKKQK